MARSWHSSLSFLDAKKQSQKSIQYYTEQVLTLFIQQHSNSLNNTHTHARTHTDIDSIFLSYDNIRIFVYIIQPCTRLQCRFIQSHIVYAWVAVTCHLHFWQNDWGLLRATSVTRGWNEYRNKSQHRKLTLEKKTLPPLLQGFVPATFRSRVRSLTTELSRFPWLETLWYSFWFCVLIMHLSHLYYRVNCCWNRELNISYCEISDGVFNVYLEFVDLTAV